MTAAPSLGHWLEDGTGPRLTAGTLGERVMSAQSGVPPATPRADCGPGSNPEPGIQGRVPADAVESGRADKGFTCNVELLAHRGKAGGFKVHRFVDRTGRECAYYDTTLLFPTNVQHLSDEPTGVAVLDMSNPSKPVRTATLQTPAMQTPHESLVLSERRGLLVAVMGTAAFYPGFVDIYDLNADCRYPELQSSLPVGLLGHESGFAPDGNTFYATSLFTGEVTAVDVSDPKLPVPLWVGDYPSHGLTISEDGNRAYLADLGQGLTVLDVSEIQARKPNPQERVVSRLTWEMLTIPQVAVPVKIQGRRYLVEVDEFSTEKGSPVPVSNGERVGAARIIDIENEQDPRVVSDIRLAVNQPENRAQLAGDPGASSPAQGYAAHYCSVPRYEDPGIVACSFIASGLRVFDIRDPGQAQGDRLLRRAGGLADAGRSGRPAEQLRDVRTGVRAGARRDLVLGRQHRLLRAAGQQRRMALRRSLRCRPEVLPGTPRADRPPQRRSGTSGLHPPANAPSRRPRPAQPRAPHVSLVREGLRRPGQRGLLQPVDSRPGTACHDHRPPPRSARRTPRGGRRTRGSALSGSPTARPRRLPRRPAEPAHLRRSPRQGSPRRGADRRLLERPGELVRYLRRAAP